MDCMNPYLDYVEGFARLLQHGRSLPLGQARSEPLPPPQAGAPVCLVFSPHPDDEAIPAALPWRLRQEDGWRVVNVAVTLGSNVHRRAARWVELQACCNFLSFDLLSASGESERGLERVTPDMRDREPAYWADCMAHVGRLLQSIRPQLIVCPHADDGHPAHCGTHALVLDALRMVAGGLSPHVALAEYWNTQSAPGLMVELGVPDVARLVGALSLHVGEVARNPYHLSLPAWFADSVRRGAERVGAAGSAAPDCAFAALYGWKRWQTGQLMDLPARTLPVTQRASVLFA